MVAFITKLDTEWQLTTDLTRVGQAVYTTCFFWMLNTSLLLLSVLRHYNRILCGERQSTGISCIELPLILDTLSAGHGATPLV